MKTLMILTVALLLCAGCSNVDVEAQSGDESAHDRLVKEAEPDNSRITTRARVENVPPADFPAEAPQSGLEGIIMIRVLVGVDGSPIEAEITQALHPDLDRKALEAALAGRYLPAREGEIPREAWVSVPFRYPPPAEAE